MLRVCLGFLLLCFCGFALETKPIALKIKSIDQKAQTLVLESSKGNVNVGETGVVIHRVGNGIISNFVIITEVDEDKIVGKYETFKLLEQKYLPTPIIKPRVDDEVIMRSFYSRAFIVAPNQQTYEKIKTLFPKIEFPSSDLMIADVGGKGIVEPSKKAFQEMCKIYSVGLLMIYASNGLNILDCQSFEVLETRTLDNSNPQEIQYPFFARVEAKSFWDFLKRKKDYYLEYDKLLQSN